MNCTKHIGCAATLMKDIHATYVDARSLVSVVESRVSDCGQQREKRRTCQKDALQILKQMSVLCVLAAGLDLFEENITLSATTSVQIGLTCAEET